MDLMGEALARHNSGCLAEAEELYQRILAVRPPDAEVLSNRASALLGLGRVEEALACSGAALAIEPAYRNALGNHGNALTALGRPQEALACYQALLRLDAYDAHPWNSCGNALRALGQLAEAEQSYTHCLALNPRLQVARLNRSRLRLQLGRVAAALADVDKVLANEPDQACAHTHRAAVLSATGDWAGALAALDAALAIEPNNAEWLIGRGNALRALRRPAEALACNQHALACEPNSGLAAMNAGVALLDLRRPQEARPYIERAVASLPNNVSAHANHAAVLHALNQPHEALAACERALVLDRGVASVHNNQGCAYAELNRYEEALDSYATALACEPELADAHFGAALCHLVTGNYAEGWAEYEWRWKRHGLEPLQTLQPLWRGDELAGKTILVLAEQGLGDTLQFVRLLPLLEARGATVVAAVPQALLPLLPEPVPGLRFIVEGDTFPPHDFACPMLSLPLGLGIDLQTIPAVVPYLTFKPAWAEPWRARLGPKTRPRIGIAWSGSQGHVNDANRSIPLARFAELFDDRYEIIGLQPQVRPSDEPAVAAWPALRDVRSELTGFTATAGLVATLDLVITVDTSVAHLAGGLGRPVWILLPFAPDWRWLTDRADSPWYPTARLWRQTALGDWSGVFAGLRQALNGLAISARYDEGLEREETGRHAVAA